MHARLDVADELTRHAEHLSEILLVDVHPLTKVPQAWAPAAPVDLTPDRHACLAVSIYGHAGDLISPAAMLQAPSAGV